MPEVAIDTSRLTAEAVQIAQKLVRTNTVNPYSGDAEPGSETAGQRLLAPLLEEAGAKLTWFDTPADIYRRMGVLGPADRVFTGRPNLAAEFVFGSGSGRRIIVQGHIDTVGVSGMTIDPFSGEIDEGKLWGRGSSDMKGGMAAGVAALRELSRRDSLDGSVLFLSVTDEECDGSGAGALAAIDAGYRGDVALCLDGPNLGVVRGCNGVLTSEIHLRGEGGHAAGTATAPSALERALNVARAILDFRATRPAPLNLGVLRSGTHPAVVPTGALLSVNIAYTLAEAQAARAEGEPFGGSLVRGAFEGAVRAADAGASIEWLKDLIPFATPEDHPFVAELSASHERVLGVVPPVVTFPAWSDACYLAHNAATPTLLYGAGTPGKAHSPNESAELERIENCARVVTSFLVEALNS